MATMILQFAEVFLGIGKYVFVIVIKTENVFNLKDDKKRDLSLHC